MAHVYHLLTCSSLSILLCHDHAYVLMQMHLMFVHWTCEYMTSVLFSVYAGFSASSESPRDGYYSVSLPASSFSSRNSARRTTTAPAILSMRSSTATTSTVGSSGSFPANGSATVLSSLSSRRILTRFSCASSSKRPPMRISMCTRGGSARCSRWRSRPSDISPRMRARFLHR